MYIHEVCKRTGLTKKAVLYYQEKGLIIPVVGENGYRIFSEFDVKRLKEIALYRKLGMTLDEIQEIMIMSFH